MPLIAIAALLGLIQGLSEFLPISSSGHLILAQNIFGLKEPELAFGVVVHMGTLLAVCLFYRRALIALVKELRFLPRALISPRYFKELFSVRPNFQFGILIVVGSLPTAVVGLTLKDFFTAHFTSVFSVGLALLVTGFLLRLAGRKGRWGRTEGELTVGDALIIGLAQALAIVPGFSRSGFTICAGLLAGLSRETAARFSFILSIPAIVGASFLEAREISDSAFSLGQFAIGFSAAAISGLAALSLLVKLLKSENLAVFSWWCWTVGLAALVWQALS